MVQPTEEAPTPTGDPAVVEAIELADLAGARIKDTEVAALAAGVMAPSDLVRPVANGEASKNTEQQGQDGGPQEGATAKVKIESDEESSEDEEEQRAPAGTVGGERAQQQAEGMEVEKEESSAANKGKRKAAILEAEEEGGGGGAEGRPEWMEMEPEEEAGDGSSEVSSEDSEVIEAPRRNKDPHLPLTGPLSIRPIGDVSDGEDEEFMGAALPMTKNEELEPILPLGEVSLDGAEVQEVGKILSLVEADGTIVVQGKPGLVLDEGCVLASRVVEPKENGEPSGEATGATEPLGRIHEIFGPCALPHYTVRVQGAAVQHQVVVRYQVALKKLLQMEKERADAHMAVIEKRVEEEAEAAALRDPAIAIAAEEAALKAAVAAAAEADAAVAAAAAPMTGAQIREDAMRRSRAKKKPNPNNDQKLEDIRKVVVDAQEAMLTRDLHPFSRWKNGAHRVRTQERPDVAERKDLE
ncbi:expressed unknown protein [Ectocarpus siliculosus]|uniref:Uncharacterized protein n=1 Tax=Ectocarpus siliculosus TaxID=2880 RepID=D8LTG9_ECTSI|nr:expressed unknown protein [Ectocarpus siliculosus]|eukprot:CBN78010.1 expressed unknown protein [Ectocarpus siliculosus]